MDELVNIEPNAWPAKNDKSFWWGLATALCFIGFVAMCAVCYALSKRIDGLLAQLAEQHTSPATPTEKIETDFETTEYLAQFEPILACYVKLGAELDVELNYTNFAAYLKTAHVNRDMYSMKLSSKQNRINNHRPSWVYIRTADEYFISALEKLRFVEQTKLSPGFVEPGLLVSNYLSALNRDIKNQILKARKAVDFACQREVNPNIPCRFCWWATHCFECKGGQICTVCKGTKLKDSCVSCTGTGKCRFCPYPFCTNCAGTGKIDDADTCEARMNDTIKKANP